MRRWRLRGGVELAGAARRAVIAHCAAAGDREACGLLFGREGRPPRVLTAMPLPKHAPAPDRFHVPAEEVWRLARARAAAGERLLGVYHSHPASPAAPSQRDVDGAWGALLQLIVGATGSGYELACWSVDGASVSPVRLTPASGGS